MVDNSKKGENSKSLPRVGVVGSGSFGTAITKILCENMKNVNWWVRSPYVKGYLQKEQRNPNYLSSVEFDINILNTTNDINELIENSDIIIFVTPSIYLLDSLAELKIPLKGKTIVTAIKGLIPQESKIIGEYFHDTHGIPYEDIGVIAGPCHAEEIALERLSYLTVAFQDQEKAELLANLLRCDFVNVTLSNDIIGTEHAAVLKNVYAISAGMAHGLGYGDNFIALLLSNAIREMEKYLEIVSPVERNINDSVYLGDLLVTGYSYFSRNRMFGNMIGKGYTVKSALMEMNQVPEGYYATNGIFNIASEYKIDLPILKTVHKIIYKGKSAPKSFKKLTKKLS